MFITTVEYVKTTNFGAQVETTEAWEGTTENESVEKALANCSNQNIAGDSIISIQTKQV